MSFSTAKASISGNSVVPGLPNMMLTPSCLSRSRKARFPDMTGTGCLQWLGLRALRLRRTLAVRRVRRAGRDRKVGMRADPRGADGVPHEGAGRTAVADERFAVGVKTGGAEDHRAHGHQPVGRGDDLECGQVIAIVLDRRPDMAP